MPSCRPKAIVDSGDVRATSALVGSRPQTGLSPSPSPPLPRQPQASSATESQPVEVPSTVLETRWHFSSSQADASFYIYPASHSDQTVGTAKLLAESRTARLASRTAVAAPSAIGRPVGLPEEATITDGIDLLRTFHPYEDIPAALLAHQIVQDSDQAQQQVSTIPGPEYDNETLLVVTFASAGLGSADDDDELAICSVGGSNFDELLISSLRLPTECDGGIEPAERPSSGAYHQFNAVRNEPSRWTHATVRRPSSASFKLSSPILQITAAPPDASDAARASGSHAGPRIAIRTCTEVWIGAVYRSSSKHAPGSPYAFRPLDRLPRKEDGPHTFTDIRFDPWSRCRALLTDGRGEIFEWNVPVQGKRPNWSNTSLHRLANLALDPVLDAKGKKRAAELQDGFWKLVSGPDQATVYLASATHLYRVDLHPRQSPGAAATVTQIYATEVDRATLVRSLFTSLCATGQRSQDGPSLLAACTTTDLIWYDLNDPAVPLFVFPHKRGPDRSLCLSALPSRDATVQRFVLSSRRNRLLTVYSISIAPIPETQHLQGSQGIPLSSAATLIFPQSASKSGHHLVFQHHPAWMPCSLPPSETPSSRPAIVDLSMLASHRQWSQENKIDLQTFEATDRGAVWTRFLSFHKPSDERASAQEGQVLRIESQSGEGSTVAEAFLDRIEHPGRFGLIETRILDLRNVYDACISDTLNRSLRLPANYVQGVISKLDGLAHELSSLPAGRVASLATLLATAARAEDAERGHPDRPASLHFLADAFSKKDLEADDSASAQLDEAYRGMDEDPNAIDLSAILWQLCSTSLRGRETHTEDPLDAGLEERLAARYCPDQLEASCWKSRGWQAYQSCSFTARQQLISDIQSNAKLFVGRQGRFSVASTRPGHERASSNWTYANDMADNFSGAIPSPPKGPPEVRFEVFAPRRRCNDLFQGDLDNSTDEAPRKRARTGSVKREGFEEPAEKAVRTTATTRLLLYEWEIGRPTATYVYSDPYADLMLPPEAHSRSRSHTPRLALSNSQPGTPSRSTTPRGFLPTTPRGPGVSQRSQHPPQIGASQLQPPAIGTSRRQPPSISTSSGPATPRHRPSQLLHDDGRPPASSMSAAGPGRVDSFQTQPEAQMRTSGVASQAPPMFMQSQTAPSQTRGEAQTQVEAGKFGGRFNASAATSGETKTSRVKAKKRARGF